MNELPNLEQHERAEPPDPEVASLSMFSGELSPHGGHMYQFHEKPRIKLPDVLPGNQLALQLSRDIVGKYECLLLQREAIRESLSRFKRDLGLPEDANLPICFQTLKHTAGLHSEFRIIHNTGAGYPPKVVLNEYAAENIPPQCKPALISFDLLLSNSGIFLTFQREVLEDINARLQQLYKSSSGSRASRDLRDQVTGIPAIISECTEEVRRLLHDIQASKNYLKDEPHTGMVLANTRTL